MSGLGPWVILGIVGWAGVAWIGWSLWQYDPPKAGFDLALLLEAADRVLAGQSPYDAAILAGTAPEAVGLFYSYPPPVAQAMALLTWMPTGVVLVLWAIGATLGLGLVAARVAVAQGRNPRRMAVRAMTVAPIVLPFAVAVLFGNLDAWYPLAYGALLLAVLPGASRPTRVAGGIAIAAVSIAKLHPAPLVLWVAVRAWRREPGERPVLVAALATGVAILGASLVVGGIQPWLDYIQVVRVAAGSELVDPRNIAPVSMIGLAFGIDGAALRAIQLVVVVLVVVVTLAAAVRLREPVLSFGVAAAATLVTLPVTWYHYPVALLPVAFALGIGHPATRPRLVLTTVIAGVAIAFLPLVWVAVAVLLVAAAESARRQHRRGEATAAV
jgi:hypothetical protein